MRSARLASACVLLIFAAALRPVAAQPSPDFDVLDAVVRAEMEAGGIPGAAVGVVYDGRLVYAKGFGVVSLEDPRPVTPEMLFRMGSTTKMFTAAAFVAAADAAGVSLDAPAATYADSLHPFVARVTAHQLLTHTAGLAEAGAPFGPSDEAALSAEVRGWDETAFFTGPGEIYSYASRGYWLVGYLLERLTGLRYADAMNTLVFAPLGMARTTLRPLVAMTYPLAVGHVVEGDSAAGPAVVARPAANNAATWPGGSIYSNVYDLARFAAAMMQGGRPDGARGLPAFVPERLAHPHVALPGPGAGHYGYGLSVVDYRGVRMLYHGGVSRGYGAFVQMAPAHRFAVVTLTNRHAALLFQTAQRAAEIALPFEPEAPPEPASSLPLTRDDLEGAPGTYAQGTLQWRIFARDGGLFLDFGGAVAPLTKLGAYHYRAGLEGGQEIVLVPGADGKPRHLFDGLYAARKLP